jgi:hypothetical protein
LQRGDEGELVRLAGCSLFQCVRENRAALVFLKIFGNGRTPVRLGGARCREAMAISQSRTTFPHSARGRFWRIVLKNSKIVGLRKSRKCNALAIFAAARCCRIDTRANDRICGNSCGPSLHSERDASAVLRIFNHQQKGLFQHNRRKAAIEQLATISEFVRHVANNVSGTSGDKDRYC